MIEKFSVVIVEDARLELKGTEEIFRTELPQAEVIGTASNEKELDEVLARAVPDLLLLDLGLGGSTTVGVDICARMKREHPQMKVLVFTGELLNGKLWVDVLDAGADGITLKTGELLTKHEIYNVMAGKRNVFNQPVLEKLVERFRENVNRDAARQKSLIHYEIDRYDECFLRHLALGYTKEMVASLKTMPAARRTSTCSLTMRRMLEDSTTATIMGSPSGTATTMTVSASISASSSVPNRYDTSHSFSRMMSA